MRTKVSIKFILLSLILIVMIAACGSDDDKSDPTAPANTPVTNDLNSDATPDPSANTSATAPNTSNTADTLEVVLERGYILCGVQGALPGFGFEEEDGTFSGADPDLCRALAAAVFGDPAKVEFVRLTTEERFPALTDQRIDVLIRNTTWTLTRDAELGFDFGPVTFYDGQGVLVRRGSGIFDLADLADKSVCIEPETTTKDNFDDTMAQLGITYNFVSSTDIEESMEQLTAGDCDALTSDLSALALRRAAAENPDDFALLEVVLSQEPLAPVYREGNPRWGNVIRWTIYGLIHAERLGITSENVDDFANSGVAEVEVLLGESGDMGQKLGLPNDFVAQAVKQVGNYGEIYERNLGEASGIGLARGQNALWLAGGLLYAPPFR